MEGNMNLNIRKTIGLFSLFAVLVSSSCHAILEEDEEVIKSFMPGVIRRIAVVPGQQVKRGDLLYIVEAMKMECSITSPRAGFIGSLYFTVDQCIENDMPLVTILPFMPVEKGGNPMDVDESPLPAAQSKEPFIADLPQDDLREFAINIIEVISNEESISDLSPPESVIAQLEQLTSEVEPIPESFDSEENASDVSSHKVMITFPVEQNVFENEPQMSQQEETLPLVIAPITETFDNEGEGADISLSVLEPQASQQEERLPLIAVSMIDTPNSKGGVFDVPPSARIITTPVEQFISEAENEPQTPRQEEALPLIAASMTEVLNNEVEREEVTSLPSVAVIKEKPSISEVVPQTLQQEETLPLIVASMTEVFNNEESTFDLSLPAVVIASEAKPSTSEHQVPLQISTSSWVVSTSMSLRNDEVAGSEVTSLPSVTAIGEKSSTSEVVPQTFQQEETSPLVVTSISEVINSEENISDVSSTTGFIVREAKQSILGYQAPQQQLYLFNMKKPYVHIYPMSSPRRQGSSHSLDFRFRAVVSGENINRV
ncbi:MAG: acetyl-CoA carboxylase biotin carboxyl carrier protein subunit [Alphaproteobacteria bacterium]|nr:acetyl-CoA carboxylase biotin carboxyl carrier protein subunit [Alphaproteobacteria bacterium]